MWVVEIGEGVDAVAGGVVGVSDGGRGEVGYFHVAVIVVGSWRERWLGDVLPSVVFDVELIDIGCSIGHWISDGKVTSHYRNNHVTSIC